MDSDGDPAAVLLDRMRRERFVAVVCCDASSDATRAAQSLVAGGVRIVEVTFTTPGAGGADRAAASGSRAEILVGAGTVTHLGQLDQALSAGADFAVSPSWSDALMGAARAAGVPFVPGVLTPTEMQQAVTAGAAEFGNVIRAQGSSVMGGMCRSREVAVSTVNQSE